MKDDRILDHLNEVDIYCLHYIMIPNINDRQRSILKGWSIHSVSTLNHQMPSPMFISGLLSQLQSSNKAACDSNSDTRSTGSCSRTWCKDVPLFHVWYSGTLMHVEVPCKLRLFKFVGTPLTMIVILHLLHYEFLLHY